MGVGKERRGEERVKGDGYFGDGDEDVRCAADSRFCMEVHMDSTNTF